MFQSTFFRIIAALCGIALIASGLMISNEIRHRRYRPAAPAPEASAVEPEPPPPGATDDEPRAAGEDDVRLESFGAWVALCRGRISQFPPGTPEYERFGRMLRQFFRTDPARLQESARLLLEDSTLDPFTQALIVESIARSDDPDRADATLRGLLQQEAAGDSLKASVATGFAAVRTLSEASCKELLRIAQVSNRSGRAALETMGKLHRTPVQASETMRGEFLACVFRRHADFLASEDLEGLNSSLKALVLLDSTEARARFNASLRHSNPAIRSAAIQSWSSLELPDRTRLLLDVLSTEKDAATRVEAVKGLYTARGGRAGAGHADPLVDPLLRICREDGDEAVRLAALGYFARRFNHAKLPPDPVTEAIRGLIKTDAAAANREYAEWILRDCYGLKP